MKTVLVLIAFAAVVFTAAYFASPDFQGKVRALVNDGPVATAPAR